MDGLILQYRIIVVGNIPYCVWDQDLEERNAQFLRSVDPSYFEYVADLLAPKLLIPHGDTQASFLGKLKPLLLHFMSESTEEPDQHAASLLRATYSHALETLFALLVATVQAPRAPFAWIRLYKPRHLRHIVQKIDDGITFPSMWKVDRPSWRHLANLIHNNLRIENEARDLEVKQGFSRMWKMFAYDFLSDDFTEEYNSIKHGWRIRQGGFYVAMGREETPAVSAPKENMRLLGRSDFGSSFLSNHHIGDSPNHVQFIRKYRNWNPENMLWSLKLISMSLNNVLANLAILNGSEPEDERFFWPTEDETFNKPKASLNGLSVQSMTGFHTKIHPALIEEFEEAELQRRYDMGEDAGSFRISLSDDEARTSEEDFNAS